MADIHLSAYTVFCIAYLHTFSGLQSSSDPESDNNDSDSSHHSPPHSEADAVYSGYNHQSYPVAYGSSVRAFPETSALPRLQIHLRQNAPGNCYP